MVNARKYFDVGYILNFDPDSHFSISTRHLV